MMAAAIVLGCALWCAFGWKLRERFGRERDDGTAYEAGYAMGQATERQRQREVTRQECERHVRTGERIGRHLLLDELRTLDDGALLGYVRHPTHHALCDATPESLMPRVAEVVE